MAATTALTAQNTQGVSAIHHVSSDFLVNQVDLCIDDIGVDVVKIGMPLARNINREAPQMLFLSNAFKACSPPPPLSKP